MAGGGGAGTPMCGARTSGMSTCATGASMAGGARTTGTPGATATASAANAQPPLDGMAGSDFPGTGTVTAAWPEHMLIVMPSGPTTGMKPGATNSRSASAHATSQRPIMWKRGEVRITGKPLSYPAILLKLLKIASAERMTLTRNIGSAAA